MSARAQRWRRDPFVWIAFGFALACAVGASWDIPCTDSWSNDEVSPRASMLGAVFQTWTPGHFFRYPPLHVLGLTVLQSPIILVGVLRVGVGAGNAAIEAELIKPEYMTLAAILGRAVSFLMALGFIANVRRLFARVGGERVGLFAAAATALDAIFVYFSHVASVDVPYLFWTSLALVELDRFAAGERREYRVALAVACAMLTKDQSAMLLAGPLFALFVVDPWLAAAKGARLRAVLTPRTVRAAALGVGGYLVVSGIVTNPSGFRSKLAWMKWGNEAWVSYERSVSGVLAQLVDVGRAVPIFTSRFVALVAVVGVVFALRGAQDRRLALRRAVPALAALGYLVLFVVPSRWVMERHLMPLALFVVPYAGYVFVAVGERVQNARIGTALAAIALAPQLLDVASVDATLLAEPKSQVEARLATLPPGTTVAVLGGNSYLPRLPRGLDVVRIGPEPEAERSTLPGVREVVAPYSSVAAAAPEYVVVSESFAQSYLPQPGPSTAQRRKLQSDTDAVAFFEDLAAERGDYRFELRATCKLPWPLECRRVHLSTGAESWLFRRRGPQ